MDWLRRLDFRNFNLAPYSYEKIVSNQWPIERFEIASLKNLFGDPIFECYSSLEMKLQKPSTPSKIYGHWDGTGTSHNKAEAVYKSFSEALERWACYSLSESERCVEFGFDHFHSSTGFATYPAIRPANAKLRAYWEAIERWAITHWWLGMLPTKKLISNQRQNELRTWEIITPFPNTKTILLQLLKVDSEMPFAAYGFATSETIHKAFDRAVIELDRNRRALLLLTSKAQDLNSLLTMNNTLNDRRLSYFSKSNGIEDFESAINNSLTLKATLSKPKLIVNKEAIGPWTEFAHVWRCLFENNEPTSQSVDTFFF